MTLLNLRCLLLGHDDLVAFERSKIALRCASCGRETAGWTLDRPRPIPFRDRVVRFRKRLRQIA
jgi:hypothetical protein